MVAVTLPFRHCTQFTALWLFVLQLHCTGVHHITTVYYHLPLSTYYSSVVSQHYPHFLSYTFPTHLLVRFPLIPQSPFPGVTHTSSLTLAFPTAPHTNPSLSLASPQLSHVPALLTLLLPSRLPSPQPHTLTHPFHSFPQSSVTPRRCPHFFLPHTCPPILPLFSQISHVCCSIARLNNNGTSNTPASHLKLTVQK